VVEVAPASDGGGNGGSGGGDNGGDAKGNGGKGNGGGGTAIGRISTAVPPRNGCGAADPRKTRSNPTISAAQTMMIVRKLEQQGFNIVGK
jgi:hypothetical protein